MFRTFGKAVVIDYELVRGPEGWRIGDVKARGDASLRQRVKAPGT